MSTQEQAQTKTKYYSEAIRYMDNAKEILRKASKEGNYYRDDKYTKIACGTAYSGVLKALDGYFILKQVPTIKKGSRKSKQYYENCLSNQDWKILSAFETAYSILYLSGYYDGITRVKTINDGFEIAYEIIEKIKP